MKYIILIFFLLLPICADAQPGRLIKSGIVNTYFNQNYAELNKIFLLPNGKIMAVGSTQQNDFALAQYNEDGSLDSSFGKGGIVVKKFSGEIEKALTAVIQPDGKIMIAGGSTSANRGIDFVICRFNLNGGIDSSFGIFGKVSTVLTNHDNDAIFSITLQRDGKILAAGHSLNNDSSTVCTLARYKSDGRIDSNFGINGRVLTDSSGTWLAVSLQNDGKIITSGFLNSDNGLSLCTFSRYTSEGKIDSTFGINGSVIINYPGNLSTIIINPDNSFFAGGIILDSTKYYSRYNFLAVRLNSQGFFDSSFGKYGKVLVPCVDYPYYLNSILIQQINGKIVTGHSEISSTGGSGIPDFILIRLNQDGSIDSSYGNRGVTSAQSGSEPFAAEIQPDQKIIVSGWSVLIRFNITGAVDKTFGLPSAFITSNSPNDDQATTISISLQDKFLLGGNTDFNSDNTTLAAIRYQSNGTLDNTFWPGVGSKLIFSDEMGGLKINSSYNESPTSMYLAGYVFNRWTDSVELAFLHYSSNNGSDEINTIFDNFGSSSNYCQSLLHEPDGKFVLSGYAFTQRNYDFAMLRYRKNGSDLDSAFGVGGKVTTDLQHNQDYAFASALQSDNKIILAGTSYNDKQWQVALVRYNPDGSLDRSFGDTGVVLTAIHDSDDCAKSVQVQSDGKIVVAGYTLENAHGYYHPMLLRYNSNGSLDSSFGIFGVAETPVGSGDAKFNGMVIEPDGKIIAAGYSSNGKDDDFMLACYNSDGKLDSRFGTSGITTTDYGFGDDHANAVALQSDGSIVVAGYAFNGTDKDYAVARYLPDLSLGVIGRKSAQSISTIYPNPIHSSARLEYELSKAQPVTIKLFDILGNGRAILVQREIRNAGKNSEVISLPQNLPTGSYYLRIETEESALSIKIIKE